MTFRWLTTVLLVPLALAGCDSGGDGGGDSGDSNAEESAGTDTQAETGSETGETGGGSVCEVETRDDDFAIGLNKSGSLVSATFVSADPAPPIKGDNTWVIDFTDLQGNPLAGLTMTAVPMMPDHGHGTPIDAIVTELDQPGRYQITPVNLFMTGYWETTFDITLDGGGQDSLMFGFCVE